MTMTTLASSDTIQADSDSDSPVVFRGTKDGFEVQIQRFDSVDAVTAAMRKQLAKAPAFFRGADVVLRFSGVPVLGSFAELDQVVRDFGLRVVAVRSDIEASSKTECEALPESSEAQADDHGAVVEHARQAAAAVRSAMHAARTPAWIKNPPDHETEMVRGPLRSGSVLSISGDVTIIGDANPGSEIIAGGNIVVLGALRGVAHAGCAGGDGFIWAYQLRPQQLRIGRLVARAADSDIAPTGAEIAYATDGRIIVEGYSGKIPAALTRTRS